MTWIEIEIALVSGFATLLRGSTLFGHCCALLGRQDPRRIAELVDGYADGRPFAVLGDPRPLGHVPRPTLPMHLFHMAPGFDRKEAKAKRWTPTTALGKSVEKWLAVSRSDAEVAALHGAGNAWRIERERAAARCDPAKDLDVRWDDEWWFAPSVPLVIDLVLDERRFDRDDMLALIKAVGMQGYGAGATRGLGKFEIGEVRCPEWPGATKDRTTAMLALGHCVPRQVDRKWLVNSYYRTMVHHGRHGADTGHPAAIADIVKAPVLLAQPGALLCAPSAVHSFYGLGLGGGGEFGYRDGKRSPMRGGGNLSIRDPRTLMQGYAPVLQVRFDGLAKSSDRLEAAA